MKSYKWYYFWRQFWGYTAVVGWIFIIFGAIGSYAFSSLPNPTHDDTITFAIFFVGLLLGLALAGLGGNLEDKYRIIALGDERWRWCPNADGCEANGERCEWTSRQYYGAYGVSCSEPRDPNNPPKRKDRGGHSHLEHYMKSLYAERLVDGYRYEDRKWL
jgi:hypothetical protein